MDVPNTTPDMEDNGDTEVDVERKYILEVNDETLDNINLSSFKDSNSVQARVVEQTIDREEIVKLFVTELFIAFGLEFSLEVTFYFLNISILSKLQSIFYGLLFPSLI